MYIVDDKPACREREEESVFVWFDLKDPVWHRGRSLTANYLRNKPASPTNPYRNVRRAFVVGSRRGP
ncbi:hypothetical protein quinque_015342 [Culex quinquefasciatus]